MERRFVITFWKHGDYKNVGGDELRAHGVFCFTKYWISPGPMDIFAFENGTQASAFLLRALMRNRWNKILSLDFDVQRAHIAKGNIKNCCLLLFFIPPDDVGRKKEAARGWFGCGQISKLFSQKAWRQLFYCCILVVEYEGERRLMASVQLNLLFSLSISIATSTPMYIIGVYCIYIFLQLNKPSTQWIFLTHLFIRRHGWIKVLL